MSRLVLLLAGCSSTTALPLGEQLTEQGLFVVTARHAPDPPAVLEVEADGAVALAVAPWMPEHGHGAGPVEVDDWEARWAYPMAGYWELTVTLDDGEVSDAVVYGVDVR